VAWVYITECLIVNQRQPLLVIDWSPINESKKFQWLRVGISMGGRALRLLK